ncbi:MAG: hypothetical protein AB7V62_14695 [Thermoleophilia bacterium]
MPTTFPLRRNAWTWPVLALLGGQHPTAEVDEAEVRVRMGWHGSATFPVAAVDRVGTMEWPWWGGVGVRITKGMVAFVGSPGTLVVIDLAQPRKVRAPLSWTTAKLAVGVEDAEAFMAAVALARRP